MKTFKLVQPLLTAICLLLATEVRAEPAKIKALIIDGQNNHKWAETTPLLKLILENSGVFTVDVSTTPPKMSKEPQLPPNATEEQKAAHAEAVKVFHAGDDQRAADSVARWAMWRPRFSDYGVIIGNYNGEAWPEEVRQALVDYVKSGGGYVSYHAADNAFADWADYNEMIGLGGWGGRTAKAGPYLHLRDGAWAKEQKLGACGGHGPQAEFLVETFAPDHPIMKGLPPKWMHAKDELYHSLRGPAENLSVLGSALSGVTHEEEPMLMAIRFGKGRVFHTTLGHYVEALDGLGFQVTFSRGAEWAATGNVTQPAPAPGVLSEGPTATLRPLKPVPAAISATDWQPLLDAHLTNWEKFLGIPRLSITGLPPGTYQGNDYHNGTPLGLNNDPKNVFTVRVVDGEPVLHITGEIYGCITTLNTFSNYHFHAQFRWGQKKWPPREHIARDSGVLYHSTGPHGAFWNVWKSCIEFQVCEGEIGKLYALAGTAGTVAEEFKTFWSATNSTRINPRAAGTVAEEFKSSSGPDYHENPTGEWNDLEIYTLDDSAVHLLNGQVVNVLTHLTRRNQGNTVALVAGQIQIQSEGAEVEYRRIETQPITNFPADFKKYFSANNTAPPKSH